MINLRKVCRLCLYHFHEENLLSPDQRSTEALFFLFKLQVDTNIPFKMCRECHHQLLISSVFHAKVVDNQSRLWDLVLSQQIAPNQNVFYQEPQVQTYSAEMIPTVATVVEVSYEGNESTETSVEHSDEPRIYEIENNMILPYEHQYQQQQYQHQQYQLQPSREELPAIEDDEDVEDMDDPPYEPKVLKKRSQCDICSVWVYSVKQHKKCVHEFMENQTCHACNRTFPNKLKLLMHNYYKHTPCKYKCQICEKPIRSPGLLREHVHQKHLKNVWLYSCNICGSKYNYRTSLLIHQKRQHNYEPRKVKPEPIFKPEPPFNQYGY